MALGLVIGPVVMPVGVLRKGRDRLWLARSLALSLISDCEGSPVGTYHRRIRREVSIYL